LGKGAHGGGSVKIERSPGKGLTRSNSITACGRREAKGGFEVKRKKKGMFPPSPSRLTWETWSDLDASTERSFAEEKGKGNVKKSMKKKAEAESDPFRGETD